MHMVTKYLGCSLRTTILSIKKCQGFLFFKCRGRGGQKSFVFNNYTPSSPRPIPLPLSSSYLV